MTGLFKEDRVSMREEDCSGLSSDDAVTHTSKSEV